MIIKLASLYVSDDKALLQAALRNEHMPEGSRHLFKFVNWSDFLPEKYKKNHVYTEPVLGKLNASYQILLDTRASPLLASDSQLQSLPLTYVLTCEHDLLRDDGLIFIKEQASYGHQQKVALQAEATLFESIGLMKYEELFSIITDLHFTKPVSDENVTVIDTNFSNIPVRLYLPKRKSERQRPAVIYIHGGAFIFGSCSPGLQHVER
ncbi:hypothetical protein STEG23_014566 [Scotinomys teguina]